MAGPYRFFASNLTRASTQPLATLYFGKIYEFSLPWHNTLVLTAITTPVPCWRSSLIGTAACLSRAPRRALGLDLAAKLADLDDCPRPAKRTRPRRHPPDSCRVWRALAVLAGLGAAWLAERFQTGWRRATAVLLITAAASLNAWSGSADISLHRFVL